MKNKAVSLIVSIFFLMNLCSCFHGDVQGLESGITWGCTIHIDEVGEKQDEIVFGEAPDARDGPPADIYDVVKPPTPLVPYLRAWFTDNLPAPYNFLWEDYRSFPDTSKTWNVSIQWIPSDYYTATTVTITWDTTETSASEYSSMTLCTDSGVVLKNMLLDESYSFSCPANVPQMFQIVCMKTNTQPDSPNVPNGAPTGYHGSAYFYSTLGIDPDGDFLFYQFDWGNTIQSSWLGPFPSGEVVQTSYTWDAPGSYPVKARVKDIYGLQSSWSGILTVDMINRAPSQPTNPVPYNGESDVQEDPILSWIGDDPDGDIVTFDVYFGISSPPPKVVNNQSDLSFHPGTLRYKTTYYWQVIAWDCFGDSTSSSFWSFTTKASDNTSQEPGDINQTNTPPVADASLSQQTGFVGLFIILNGSGSYDADGFLTSWLWDFGDGTQGTGERTIHAYESLGIYTVTLSVTDNKGATGTDFIIIEIGTANQPPTKPIITGTRIGTKHTRYTYTVSATDPENDFLQYRIRWGDETVNETQFVSNGTVFSFSHSWNVSGKYVLTATATDNISVSPQSTMEVFIDVRFIQDLGFLFDAMSDGLFDSFYSNTTSKITSAHRLENGSYLLDTDGDGKWNYLYNPNTGSLTLVGFGITTIENPWLFIIIIMAAVIIIIIIVYLYKKNYF